MALALAALVATVRIDSILFTGQINYNQTRTMNEKWKEKKEQKPENENKRELNKGYNLCDSHKMLV